MEDGFTAIVDSSLSFYLGQLDLKRNCTLLERAVDTIESRFTTRVLRTLPSIRRRLTAPVLAQVITEYYGNGRLHATGWRPCAAVKPLPFTHYHTLFISIDERKNELLQLLGEVSVLVYLEHW